MHRPKALLFDVFGTCVDWRSSVARDVTQVAPHADGFAVALAWRAEYDPAMARIRAGNRGYVPLEILHRENLDRVMAAFGVTPADPDWLNDAWERLTPWPDTLAGLAAMRDRMIVAPCSNGSIAMMTRLARYADLPWDCILGADLARDYKPSASVYLESARALRLDPSEVMMVAAHNGDLFAAREVGMTTAFVHRPEEFGPDQTTDLTPEADWDIVAQDFIDLARRLA